MSSARTFRVLDSEQLAAAFPEPESTAATKKRSSLGLTARRFLAHSPFVCIASRSSAGADCSPRGDEPGFTRVLGEQLLAIPDRAGNNLADSFRNIAEEPDVGLLFLVPGLVETLRVNGRGYITDDVRVCDRFSSGPAGGVRLSLVVEVTEVFFHCGKAVLRSELWSSSTTAAAAVALGSNVFALENCEQPRLDLSVREMKKLLDDGYSHVEPL